MPPLNERLLGDCSVTPGCHDSVCGVKYGSGVDLFSAYAEQAFFAGLGARWCYLAATLFGVPADPIAWYMIFASSVLVGGGLTWYYYDTFKSSTNANVALIANNPGTAYVCAELGAGWARALYYGILLVFPDFYKVAFIGTLLNLPTLIGLAITYYNASVLIYPVQDALWLGVILWGKVFGWTEAQVHDFPPPNQPVCDSWELRTYDWLAYSFWNNAIKPLISSVEAIGSSSHKALAAAEAVLQLVLLPPLIGINLYVGFVDFAVGEIAKALYCSG
jgi:hypothetical protein